MPLKRHLALVVGSLQAASGAGGAAVQPSLTSGAGGDQVYDCKEGYASRRTSWSELKKAWCCEKRGWGCDVNLELPQAPSCSLPPSRHRGRGWADGARAASVRK
ncbi:unnamed protein product, partial [Prorocentrum cordatum]